MAVKKEKNKKANRATPNTQKYLQISEIKENVVILKDGSLRAVILVSSINFALKSSDEQQALVAGYIDFINSFKDPFQIVIQSRKLNMDKYLTNLKVLENDQKNELLKAQMSSYRQYIQELVDLGDIMTKRFYVVVTYSPDPGETKTFFQRLNQVIRPGALIKLSQSNFDKQKHELDIRVSQVGGQLASMGLKAVQLDTQSLIELYYSIYNPTTAANQPLEDINDVRMETSF